MSGLEFSVPFNDDPSTVARLFEMSERGGNRIREFYMGVPNDIAGSGRVGAHMSHEHFAKVVDLVHSRGIAVDMTMNSTCEGSDWYSDETVRKTVDFIREMHEDHGVEAVTLANPLHISAVREACPDIEISASVLAEIDCYERAEVFKSAGANVITPATSINRDVKALENIANKLGLEVKLMVNEGCLYKCPYRLFHMNYISHQSREEDREGREFALACGDLVDKNPALIFRSNWVRPEELTKYAKATKYFKIVGRDMLASKVVRAVGAYLDESYEGNLLDLLCSCSGFYSVEHGAFIDNKELGKSGYFKRLSSCNRKCHSCSYCDELVDTYLRYGRVSEENLLDMGQYDLVAAVKAQCGGVFPKSGEYSKRPIAR